MKICLIAILTVGLILSIPYLTDSVFADDVVSENKTEASVSTFSSDDASTFKSFSDKKIVSTAVKDLRADTEASISVADADISASSDTTAAVPPEEVDDDIPSDSDAHRIMLSFGSAFPIFYESAYREKYTDLFGDDTAEEADNPVSDCDDQNEHTETAEPTEQNEQNDQSDQSEQTETDPIDAAIAAVAAAADSWRDDIIFSSDYTVENGIDQMTVTLYRHESGKTVTLSLADYVTGIVAAEMPSYFDYEARCAQAISARTYVLYKMKNGGIAAEHPDVRLCDGHVHCCAYVTRDDLAECWGNPASADIAYAAAAEAVAATSDTVVLYGGEAICAVWHSRSNVATVSAESVWGYHIPYLLGAPTPEEGGYRYGHGVGLSQYGAEAMAQLGYDAASILSNYYANCEIVKLSAR